MSAKKQAAKARQKHEKRLQLQKLVLERDTSHLKRRGTKNFSLYSDRAASGPLKAMRRIGTSYPKFPPPKEPVGDV